MVEPLDEPAESSRVPAPALGRRTGRGVLWLVGQTLGTRAVALAGQVVLAWLLAPQHFAQVALAYTVTAFAAVLAQPGLDKALVMRGRRFDRWSSTALWLAGATGLLGAAVMAGAAPLAALFYGDRTVAGLILVVAMAAPFQSLAIVPFAHLQYTMRFGVLAWLRVGYVTATMGLSVVLAALGCGAYSFVIPMPIVAAAHLVVLLLLVRPRLRMKFQRRRWRYLIAVVAVLLPASFIARLSDQADYIILGRWLRDQQAVVGLYYFAFGLSVQVVGLLANSLNSVLFAALSALQTDRPRQYRAFVSAVRGLAIVGVPLCLLQAVVAEPLLHVLFDPKWYSAAPLLSVLSVAMAFRLVGHSYHAQLLAIHRQGMFLRLTALQSAVFVVAVLIGAWRGEAMGVAAAVLVVHALVYPFNLYVSMRLSGGNWRDLVEVMAAPLAVGAAAMGAAWWVMSRLPEGSPALRLVVAVGVGLPLYGSLIWTVHRRACVELWLRLKDVLRR